MFPVLQIFLHLDITARAFRVDYSYARDTFPHDQALFNILAPATVKTITLSPTRLKTITKSAALPLTQRMPRFTVKTPIPVRKPVIWNMEQWELGLGWSKRF